VQEMCCTYVTGKDIGECIWLTQACNISMLTSYTLHDINKNNSWLLISRYLLWYPQKAHFIYA